MIEGFCAIRVSQMKERFFHHRGLFVAVLLFATLGPQTGGPRHFLAFASQASRSEKKASPAKPLEPEAWMPFHAGERLDYRVAWSSFNNAATVELSVPERRDLFGWRVWHFQTAVHTMHSVRSLFPIDDQFDSYTDVSSLESRQFEMYLNELGKRTTTVLHLIPAGQRPRIPGPVVMVLPGTRDPLAMLFTLSGTDWQRHPEVRVPVYDGHNLYEVFAHLEANADSVEVDAGSFTASRVSIRVFQDGKEKSDIRFTIWFANDVAHTPVQFVAELPFGSLRVGLTSEKIGAEMPLTD